MYKLFEDPLAAGNFATEIYAAKRSPFWLSSAFDRDVVRIDPFWWAHNPGRPENYFSRFWSVLLPLAGARLRWGKYLPRLGQRCGAVTFSPESLRRVYPRLQDWLRLRAEFDPGQVFLTEYWRLVLGLPR